MAKVAKATSRKHAPRRKVRAHRAVKARARRPSMGRPAAQEREEVRSEPMGVDDESTLQAEPRETESRAFDDDADAESGIYGPGRGETAG